MRRPTRTVITALMLLALAAPAVSAKGGREGELKVTSAADPFAKVVTCADPRITSLPAQEQLIIVPLNLQAGCLAVRNQNGNLTIAASALSTYWVAVDEGSDASRVRLELQNAYRGQKFDVTVTTAGAVFS